MALSVAESWAEEQGSRPATPNPGLRIERAAGTVGSGTKMLTLLLRMAEAKGSEYVSGENYQTKMPSTSWLT